MIKTEVEYTFDLFQYDFSTNVDYTNNSITLKVRKAKTPKSFEQIKKEIRP